MKRTRTTRPLVAVAAGTLAVLALAGCGGSGDAGSSAAGADNSAPKVASQPGERGAASAGGGAADGTSTPAGQSADAASFEQRIVRTADLAVQTDDVAAGVGRVRSIAEAAKGFVADEQTTTSPSEPRPVGTGGAGDPAGPSRPWSQSVLTLRVPNASLDRVMQQVGDLGSVTSRSQTSQDVTGKYVDTASRVRSQTASVARVRALLAQAKDLGQIVQIEGELARREADLESLKSQLAALDDQTTLSTLTVTLTPHETTQAVQPHDNAFVAGLRAGWTALTAGVVVLLTIVGALLPFALAAAVLGAPVLWWLRRQRRRRGQAPAPAA